MKKLFFLCWMKKLLKLEWPNPVVTDETAGSLGGAISSVVSFYLSSRLWIPHQVIRFKLSSHDRQQALKNSSSSEKNSASIWSCEHGHGGECTACTKRTAQASKSHQIKRTVQISSGTIAIVMWEGGACMTKKYRHDIVYTVRIKEWVIWGIQYHIWGCRKNVQLGLVCLG